MTHDKPLCPDAWAIPPTPLMLKHGNDYHTCSKCGEPVETVNLRNAAMTHSTDDEPRNITGALVSWLEEYHELDIKLLKFEHPADRESFYKLAERLIQAYTAAKVREALQHLKRYEMSLDAMLEIDRLIAELTTNTEEK